VDKHYIQKVWCEYFAFCDDWANYFFDNPEIWPKGHKWKSEYYAKRHEYGNNISSSLLYDYDYKQKSNLFGLDTLYRNMPKKSFTKGRKQEFEFVLIFRLLKISLTTSGYLSLWAIFL
jgi:hypothetical protein